MTRYLNHDALPSILERFYGDPGEKEKRLAGTPRRADCGYFDIVRFFEPKAVIPSRVPIIYQPGTFSLLDPVIRQFGQRMQEQLRRDGKLRHGPVAARVASFDPWSDRPTMTLQEANYGDQAGTCFVMDYRDSVFEQWGGTLRHYVNAVYPCATLSDSPLGVCLGIGGFLMIEESAHRYIVRVHRAGHLASLEDSYGLTVAGSVDFKAYLPTLGALIESALGQEIEEEVRLESTEYQIVPLAYAREILRGERPQLFCLITTDLNRKQVSERLTEASRRHHEFDQYDFLPLVDGRLELSLIDTLNWEAKMGYYLTEEFLLT